MPAWVRSSLLVLILVPPIAVSSAQDKPTPTKVVMELEKSAVEPDSFVPRRFGLTCHSSKDNASRYHDLQHSASIVELFGSPVAVVRIRSYGCRWKTPDEVRNHVIRLLATRTTEVYQYEPWAEMVYDDMVAIVQFSDKSEGTLEESGGHVCLSDHRHAVIWARVKPEK